MAISDMGRTYSIRSSDQVPKAPLRRGELADAEPKEEDRHCDADPESRQIELALAAQDAPAEPVDDTDHRIERVEQPPILRHDARAESDRRDVEAELDQERNHETEV